MPETVSGPPSDPARGDSAQGIKDTLARLEAKIDRLAEQLADAEAEAEEIMRRATSPPGPATHRAPRRRRGDTILYVVKGVAIAGACLVALIAFMAPTRARDTRYTPHRCLVACARPVAHVDSDGDHDGG